MAIIEQAFKPESPNRVGRQIEVSTAAELTTALAALLANDVIYLKPGNYAGAFTIPYSATATGISLIGAGPRGSVQLTGTGATTILTNEAHRTVLRNITLNGDETALSVGLLNRGRGRRYSVGRILNVAISAKFTLGTPTQVTAGTHSDGSDTLCEDVEFSWGTSGVELIGVADGASNFGTTQNYFRRCTFHNLTAASVTETPSAVTQSFRDLELSDCIFKRVEAGTEPTKYLDLNDDNANSGIVTRCSFPTALTGGKNLVSTALLWVSNYHTGGVSTGQPS